MQTAKAEIKLLKENKTDVTKILHVKYEYIYNDDKFYATKKIYLWI